MVFSSLQFILGFLPVFFLIYYMVPNNKRNLVLLLGSFTFYFIGTYKNPEHMIIFLVSIIADFYLASYIENHNKFRKAALIFDVILHVLFLGFFKYFNFAYAEFSKIFTDGGVMLKIALPIGISFYTFQGISYVVDVYRGKTKAEKSLLNYAVYISMFAQLIAGPIVNYSMVSQRLNQRVITKKNIITGIEIFVLGLGLKVLLANPLGKMWSGIGAIGYDSISTPLAWMSIFAFTFQLYFDFFGYSLMAIGLGEMLGFKLPQNFLHPYMSKSMSEFWRRWHITLGTWFKDYVYIPLGGNRKSNLITVRNLFIVWMFTGIWHGAGYNFILWGFTLFVIMVLERFCIGEFLEKHPIAAHLYMLVLIPVTWAIFSIDDISQLGVFLGRMFPIFGHGFFSVFRDDYVKYFKMYWYFFLVAIFFSTPVPFNILKKINNQKVKYVFSAIVLAASIYCMYRGFDDPFLYFRF